MPSIDTIIMYAMYVIGKVESNHNWTAINFGDPITLGMMQNYGVRAAGFLNLIKNDSVQTDWNYLLANAPTVTNAVNTYPTSDRDYWNNRDLTRAEGNPLIHVMGGDRNHLIQQNLWISDANKYITKLQTWGLSTTRAKQLIYTMCMYHQRPVSAGEVIRATGGTATLNTIHTTCKNNPIFRDYATRYNTAYNMLNTWDGESEPPDFGQILTVERGDTGGDSPVLSTIPSQLGHIIQQGDALVLYGTDAYKDGVFFYPAGANRWVNGFKPDTTPIVEEPEEGDGSDSGSTAEDNLVAKILTYINDFNYGQGAGRLSPLTSGYTDCSALVYLIYREITGLNIGTWTGAQRIRGTQIYAGAPSGLVEANLHKGDLVFYNWDGSTATGIDHVEMYIGSGQVCGHGGPGVGPTIKATIGRGAPYIMVRRYL